MLENFISFNFLIFKKDIYSWKNVYLKYYSFKEVKVSSSKLIIEIL